MHLEPITGTVPRRYRDQFRHELMKADIDYGEDKSFFNSFFVIRPASYDEGCRIVAFIKEFKKATDEHTRELFG